MSNRKKGVNVFKLAAKNFKSYFWINAKVCFIFACLTFLACLFTSYNASISSESEQLAASSASANYVYYNSEINSGLSASKKKYAEEHFPGREWHTYRNYDYANAMFRIMGMRIVRATASYFDFTYNGELKTPSDDNFSISTSSSDFKFFEEDYEEYEYRFGEGEFFVGRMPEAEDEIVLGEPFLFNYGITGDPLGAEVQLSFKESQSPIFTCTVVGVIKDEYYQLSGHDKNSYIHPATIMWSGSKLFKSDYRIIAVAMLDGFLDEEFAKGLKDVSFVYGAFNIVGAAGLLDKVTIIANTLYVIIGSALAVGLILTIALIMGKYIKIFARATGIYLTFGMSRKKVTSLLLCQILILDLISIPVSLGLSVAGYFVIGGVMNLILGVAMEISMAKLIGMLALGVAVIAALSLIFFIIMSSSVRKKTIKQLLVINV